VAPPAACERHLDIETMSLARERDVGVGPDTLERSVAHHLPQMPANDVGRREPEPFLIALVGETIAEPRMADDAGLPADTGAHEAGARLPLDLDDLRQVDAERLASRPV
jgi:hypothetical protein